ncbi:urea transport system permease protein [Clostridium algifaecis]|uniref:Urea transport system permease protein n=1 Tax=Clostridium algifaecis TaxID=1472040 RepID=A0ABS4KQK0_9CLOT|nr:urea ABC transporter permease subunit UrtB [Clostridium algifaecis]MBP2032327.1 urea transport system permease protein [Clostridium algifaecis]
MSTIILQIFNGFSVGSILLLIGLGLSITFGLMKIINMAHGELIMIGAYSTYMVQILFKNLAGGKFFSLYFILALPISFLIAMAFGILIEGIVIKHLYGRPADSLLATWGISIILQQLARSIFGAPNVDVQSPQWLKGNIKLGGIAFPYSRLFIIFIAGICIVCVYLYLYKTRTGRNIRAVMQNRNMASCLGIPTRKIDAYTFALGSGLAGIAGCALTLIGPIGPSIGTGYIVDAFMVVVLGGVGRLVGAVAGGLVMGMFSTWSEFLIGTSLGRGVVFLLIIIFLQWKSKGMFPISTRALDEEV